MFVRLGRRYLRVAPGSHGDKFFVRIDGKLFVTSLFLVLLVIEFTDVLFAIDSVPAIFGITKDPFIVFTSNMFAVMGLRALYFLLAGVMTLFRYLNYGLRAVLGFIGVKMLVHHLGGNRATGVAVGDYRAVGDVDRGVADCGEAGEAAARQATVVASSRACDRWRLG